MKRTAILRHEYDERMFDSMRARARRTQSVGRGDPDGRRILGEYAREGRRCGWTWALIGDALQVSPTTARRYATEGRP